jgi:hypothetical protein
MALEITELEKQLIHQAFYKLVNLSPRDLEKFLPESLLPYCIPPATEKKPAAPDLSALPLAEPTTAQPANKPTSPESQSPDSAPPAERIVQEELPFAAPTPPWKELSEEDARVLRMVRIKRKTKEQLDDEDFRMMRLAVNTLRRKLKHPPHKEENMAAWREELMRWGFDPERDEKRDEKKGILLPDEDMPGED